MFRRLLRFFCVAGLVVIVGLAVARQFSYVYLYGPFAAFVWHLTRRRKTGQGFPIEPMVPSN
jgi:hypothetical protein